MGSLAWLGYLSHTQVVESSNLSPSILSFDQNSKTALHFVFQFRVRSVSRLQGNAVTSLLTFSYAFSTAVSPPMLFAHVLFPVRLLAIIYLDEHSPFK